MIRHELRAPHPFEVSRFVVWDLTAGMYRVENAAGTVVSTGVGVRLLDRGVEGMGHPKADVFARVTPRGSGQVRTGTRANVRSAFLPVLLDLKGDAWVTVQRLLWACLSPDRTASWRVYAPDGSWRELNVYLDPADSVYALDPSEFAAPLGLALVADDPFWLGPEQVAATVAEVSGDLFFGPDESAPPFHVVSGNQDGSTSLVVGGDVDVWPVLTVEGPASGFRVQSLFSSSSVAGAVTVGSTQKLVIDFDPRSQAAMLRPKSATTGGTNVTAQLTGRAFFPIEPNVSDQMMVVLLTMIGAGQATLSYRPKFWRAV